ncbi:MAG: energy-coupling factor transporter transmembrane protein EcfT [Actinomycetota bacterium]|nr:energy-coupling factor transporter transmembrane protein EcfT [Actinomycetota bacterium]
MSSTGARLLGARLPTHPMAWWIWALGLAAAASRTTNPFLLLLIVAAAAFVVVARRPLTTWARGFRAYLIFGLVVVAIRTVFHIVLGGGYGETVLVWLPEIMLPEWSAGIRIGGAVTAEGLASAVYDGMRLATLLVCVGAAVTLADPRRLLKSLPGALYEAGLVVVVAVSMAPALIESAVHVRRARQLRGTSARGSRAFRSIAMPVLDQALGRAVALAAAMDARGYGRVGSLTVGARRTSAALLLAGLLGLCLAGYGLLDAATPGSVTVPALVVGVAASVIGLVIGSRRMVRSRYRPDRFDLRSALVALCGLAVAALFFLTELSGLAISHPSTFPLDWPQLALIPLIGIAIAALPGVASTPIEPPPELTQGPLVPNPLAQGPLESEVGVGHRVADRVRVR